jgi:hypothetical protein
MLPSQFKDQLETMEDIVRNTNSENRRLTKDLRKNEILLETFQAKVRTLRMESCCMLSLIYNNSYVVFVHKYKNKNYVR